MTLTRRSFLSRGACAALSATAAASALTDLLHTAAAVPLASDYKALVCVFLGGGNDSNNLVVPRGASDWNAYASARTVLAIPRAELLSITPRTTDGRDWGLHPSMAALHALFASGKLALVGNVGPLVGPLSRAQYLAGSAAVPPQLFSHSDQSVHWQTSLPDQPPRTGWGGRSADLLQTLNAGSRISTSLSISGSNTFLTGRSVLPFQIGEDGTLSLDRYDPVDNDVRSRTIRSILGLPATNLHEQTFRGTLSRALENDAILRAALDSAPPVQTVFPDTDLGRQLRMVARLVSARTALSMKRQVFFVSTGGYDTHGDQLDAHAGLLADLSFSLRAFYDATVELGVSDDVTGFTASDFSRTYRSNGEGSDHGWGSHQLVVGGSVKGGELYGKMPVLAIDGPDDTDLGRWIPSTSVDEYAATLARWFGVADGDLDSVFPNLRRFPRRNLGFV